VILIFLAVALVGLVFLIVALLFGGDLEHDLMIGDEISTGGPGVFSFPTFAVFLTSFGAVGALASYALRGRDGVGVVSSLLGLLGGVVLCAVYLLAMRLVYSRKRGGASNRT
jgi:hypothetical protein